MTYYPGNTVTQHGKAYTLIAPLGRTLWIAEDESGQAVEILSA